MHSIKLFNQCSMMDASFNLCIAYATGSTRNQCFNFSALKFVVLKSTAPKLSVQRDLVGTRFLLLPSSVIMTA